MVREIQTAASNVGITTFITNSNERIESQLNRITGIEDLPIMLISWDFDTTLSFDEHGFLDNPSTKIICLLMTKAEDTTHKEYEKSANEMGNLFQVFVQELYSVLIPFQKVGNAPVTEIGYQLVPKHGGGKHSGILGRFTIASKVINCKDDIYEC